MKTAEYDYHLPEELIALRPTRKRDDSRLLVLHRDSSIEHKKFHDLPSYVNSGDMLILNNSKVFPARLSGFKPTGGKLDILLVKEISAGLWSILSREKFTGWLRISADLSLDIFEGKTAQFEKNTNVRETIWKEGRMPLPPYIKRLSDETDKERYQTIYAENEGSIAAPTAGLHFTKELLENIRSKGVLVRNITLHVGTGTFKPVKAEEVSEHVMDKEFFEIDPDLLKEINEVKRSGHMIFTVGTTSTRALEGYLSGRCIISSSNGAIKGMTDMFIYEGYDFKAVDSLITNFHLPCSTPLMLTSALAGRENLLKAYRSAVTDGYRFFSYGDAMLVL
ncbi:MAG: tRNA preQ1(34) S-adenosylmethionine ribosyltransferase-isomerase QueA [Nitrospirae bacterium GWC2_42_7]|nr:MAG: tRNA preQ1(34) S-adenosylmethionine ribosyltransferase-isomerase QueA [Nitrospirae bacterium GWC2_42_7]